MKFRGVKSIVLSLAVLSVFFLCCACTITLGSPSSSDKNSGSFNGSVEFFNVTFDPNGGSMGNLTARYNSVEIINLPVPTKRGYEFTAWTDSKNKKYLSSNDLTKSVSLVAEWKAIDYSITYNLSGGINNSLNPKSYTVEDAFTLKAPSKDVNNFVGWTTPENSEPKSSVSIEKGTIGDLVFNAIWEVKQYDATFVLLVGENEFEISTNKFVFGNQVVFPNESEFKPAMEVGVFSGWFLDKKLKNVVNDTIYTMPSKNVVFYCSFGLPKYTVQVVGENNVQISYQSFDEQTESFTLSKPEREGYTFVGFVSDEIVIPTINVTIPKGTNKNLKYTAIFSINTVTISFVSNGGTTVSPIIRECFSEIEAPQQPEKDPFEFLGWYTANVGGELFEFSTMPTTNVVLYARWSNNPTYNLSIIVQTSDNKPCGDLIIINSRNSSRIAEGVSFELEAKMFSSGYNFDGWYVGNELQSRVNKFNYVMPASNLTITAKYNVCNYSSFDKTSNANLTLQFSSNVQSASGSKIVPNDYSINGKNLTIKNSFLKTLDVGDYAFMVSTVNEEFYYYLTITASDLTNVRIDYDVNYPNVTLFFEGDENNSYKLSLNGGAGVDVRNGDVIVGFNKAIDNSVKVTCVETGVSKTVLREGYTAISEKFYNSSFTYNGKTYDYVINNLQEFNLYCEYFAMVESIKNLSFSSEYPFGRSESKFFVEGDFFDFYKANMSNLFQYAFSEFSAPHISQYQTSISSGVNEGISGLIFTFDATINSATSLQEKALFEDSQSLLTNSSRPLTFNDFFIEKQTKTQVVNNVFELESLCVGIKPIITDLQTSALYDAAKNILRSIIDDDMNEFEKVEAIYDWLALNVTYDQFLLDNVPSDNYSAYRSFSSVGAIIDKVAVCDGFASAFKLMCIIEGIDAFEVTGLANGGGHAWNKVNIGGKCYGVDVTWSRIKSGENYYVTHQYLFMDEQKLIESGHSENVFMGDVIIDDLATSSYSYYEMQIIDGGYDFVVDSQMELTALLNYMAERNVNTLEIVNNVGSSFNGFLSNSLSNSLVHSCSLMTSGSLVFIIRN